MATLPRHDPLRDLFALQNQLFRAFENDPQQAMNAAWSPLVDVFENQDGIVLQAELPGIEARHVDIQVEGTSLTLKGERTLENEREGYHRIERTYGSFSRTFTLPPTVDVEHIRAESKDGVLRVFLPRKAEARPRQIKVQVESALGSQASPANKQ